MENKKPVYKKNTVFSPNKLVAVVGYIVVLFVVSSIVTYIFAFIYSQINGLNYNDLIESITKPDVVMTEEISKGNAITQGWTNLIVYLIGAFIAAFYIRDDVATDFKDLGKRKKFHLWYIPLTAIGFSVVAYLLDIVMSNFVSESTNQQTIVNIMTSGGAIPMIIATVFLAPFLEELIYRKCIFYYLKKQKIWVSYLASILLFALPHMLSTADNILVWLLQFLPYAACGGMLAFIYHKSNYNIYSSIAAHMLNNIVAVVFVYINM